MATHPPQVSRSRQLSSTPVNQRQLPPPMRALKQGCQFDIGGEGGTPSPAPKCLELGHVPLKSPLRLPTKSRRHRPRAGTQCCVPAKSWRRRPRAETDVGCFAQNRRRKPRAEEHLWQGIAIREGGWYGGPERSKSTTTTVLKPPYFQVFSCSFAQILLKSRGFS